MSTLFTEANLTPQEQTTQMLHELSLPVHRIGYKQLCVGIPYCRQLDIHNLSKDLYPYLASMFDQVCPKAVEHSVREVIHCSWDDRDPEVWERYFPGAVRPPSNKQFIAVLAERLK